MLVIELGKRGNAMKPLTSDTILAISREIIEHENAVVRLRVRLDGMVGSLAPSTQKITAAPRLQAPKRAATAANSNKKKSANPNKKQAADPAADQVLGEKIVQIARKKPITITGLTEKLRIDFYRMQRVIEALVKAKKLVHDKSIAARGNHYTTP